MNMQQLSDSILSSLNAFWIKIAQFVPNLIAAIALLLIGYFISKFIGYLVTKILGKVGIDKLSDKIGLSDMMKKAGIKSSISKISGAIVKWLILFTFLITATEALGLDRVSATIDDLVLYLPKVLGAVVILIIGLTIGHFIQGAIRSAAETMSLSYAKGLASFANVVIMVVTFSLAFGQLELEADLLNYIILALILAAGVGAAISLGLGSKALSQRIISGIYVRELIQPGQKIEMSGYKGTVVQVSTVKTIIKDDNGNTLLIPNDELISGTITTK